MDKKDEKDILKEYKDVFKGLVCVPGLHHTHIETLVTPVVHPPRKGPLSLNDKIKCELERIEKQIEHTQWLNSMVTVQKPSKKIRLCIDTKDLIEAIKRKNTIHWTHSECRVSKAGPTSGQTNKGHATTT